MSSEDTTMKDEESNRDKWNRKKKPIIENINTAIKNREYTLYKISQLQDNFGKATEILTEDVSRLRSIRQIYDNNEAYLRLNPVMEGSINIMTSFSAYDAEYTRGLASEARRIKTNTDSFLGTLNVSGSVNASNMGTVTVHLADRMENKEAILPIVEVLKRTSARDRRTELSSKLTEINDKFSTKLEGAWQTLQDHSKSDRFLQAASSARELISDLLCTLAPDDKVMETKWFKPERENGKPTQRQRARFTMLGTNNSLGEEQLKPIHELMNSIRNSYERLNPIAHLRDYEADLQAHTESLIDQCQVYLLKILEIRKSYFKP